MGFKEEKVNRKKVKACLINLTFLDCNLFGQIITSFVRYGLQLLSYFLKNESLKVCFVG